MYIERILEPDFSTWNRIRQGAQPDNGVTF